MTQYVGIDIVEIERIRGAVVRWGDRFLKRVYTDAEISAYGTRPESLAARFACKEAVVKLLGAARKGLSYRDIEALSLPDGRPLVRLYGKALVEAERLGISEIAVSLAHSRGNAVASVAGTGR
ncbi:MAG: holo-ACP synthase [Chloroflexi bacterium]|nr:holo-ACP synthase [Chloroflexota bacterium]